MLIELGGEFDGIDEFGRTRLVTAVMNGELKTAKVKKTVSRFFFEISLVQQKTRNTDWRRRLTTTDLLITGKSK